MVFQSFLRLWTERSQRFIAFWRALALHRRLGRYSFHDTDYGSVALQEEMMKPIRLAFVPAVLAVLPAVAAHAASSDAGYPQHKPIRFVVPFTAGSATDIMARLVGPRLGDRWGRQVVTDNRASAGGIVACQIVAEAAPDGHTLLVTGSNFAASAP